MNLLVMAASGASYVPIDIAVYDGCLSLIDAGGVVGMPKEKSHANDDNWLEITCRI
jgi:hypothetical protein